MAAAVLLAACSPLKKYAGIAAGPDRLEISLPDEAEPEPDVDSEAFTVDSSRTSSDGPLILNAIRDSETGEMTATDVISASKVVARFRNIAERLGSISFSFDVSVPEALISSEFQLRFSKCLFRWFRVKSTTLQVSVCVVLSMITLVKYTYILLRLPKCN